MKRLIYFLIVFAAGVQTSFLVNPQFLIEDFKVIRRPQLSFADASHYDGDLSDDGQMQGFGRLTWGNSDYYEGGFENGLFNGAGKLVFGDNDYIEAQFVNGMVQGKGIRQFSNGSRFKGEFTDNRFDGLGTISYLNGNYYEGEFRQDLISGHGKWVVSGDYEYMGRVENGLFHGEGKIQYENGASYTGEFRAGKKQGLGVYKNAQGDSYSGDFNNDAFTGDGSYNIQDGSFYVGSFMHWLADGEAIKTDADGNQWQGEFSAGHLSGQGNYIGVDGSRYTGQFKNGLYEGVGELLDKDGNRFTGSFIAGRFHGKGVYVYSEPVEGVAQFSGRWEQGNLVEGDENVVIQSPEAVTAHAIAYQRETLEAHLAALRPNDVRRSELYVLGIAGFAMQEVFRRELAYLETLFAQRFDTTGKSLYLVNSRRSIDKYPLATVDAIGRSIDALSNVMDKEEDILFVYMTSHGSVENGISLAHRGLALADIDAKSLSDMLAASGIRHQVIVLSACYSGGFVDEIKADNRLILTSAAKDKRSFGCHDDRLFTFFGKAYLKRALSKNASFIDAFYQAKVLINEWETAKKYEPSLPQIHEGEGIRDKLEQWREQGQFR